MSRVEPQVYEFGPFRLIVPERRLLRRGKNIPLTAKVFDLLLFLLQRSGQVIEKGDLMSEIWPDSVVEEANLSVNIFTLRKALGERPGDRQYIKTIPKRGYCFVAKVRAAQGSDPTPRARGRARTSDDEAQGAAQRVCSLAVLPLVNVGGDRQVEYLSDGLTESIINRLSKLPLLRITAGSTVFRYKDHGYDVREVGRGLQVRAVLVGKVSLLDERIIINVELVDVEFGSQIWGERYNRPFTDILKLQEEMALTITEALRLKLSSEEKARLTKSYTESAAAYRSYLKGRYFWNTFSKEGLEKSINYFRQAIDLDAAYALAYTGLADAYFRLANFWLPPREVLPLAKQAALKAVEFDEELAEAHASLGTAKLYYDHDWAGAESEYQRAIELNPRVPLAYQRYGSFLVYSGRFEEAMVEYQTAEELDPLSLHINLSLAASLYLTRRFGEARQRLRNMLELDGDYSPAHFILGCVHTQAGSYGDALAEFQKVSQLEATCYLGVSYTGYVCALSGQRRKAEAVLKNLREASEAQLHLPLRLRPDSCGAGRAGSNPLLA